ncbi:hypothetical protein SAMN05421781_0328 [Marinococcus luteus]|uniref:Uncharacterized protein n=1 Tax=Marinococcus luteus TaxID=1122204 RepID=A0A1H2QI42_9BACI|nr:hypothetical protein [Marinococcus luteus]SDW06755.1 hypothetical protein SAMN05421781_0328 [Marinococcus luteus]
MKYEMKHAVFEEMFQATDGRIPTETEALIKSAHQSKEVALILPFYMYCFHPHEWKEYTLVTDDPLLSTLNYAAHIALDAPTLYADKQIKRFFYGAASLTSAPESHQTAMPLEDWTYYLFRKYHRLYERTRFFETRVEVKDCHPKEWLVKITK